MKLLAERGIELAFLSARGKFNFRIVPDTSKNIYLRMAQHRMYDNKEFRLNWSKNIVGAKLKNQRNLLMRLQKSRKTEDIGDAKDELEKCLENLNSKNNVDEVMGVEGYGSKIFFKAYGKCLHKGFTFSKREFYPPPDPVNALLSFGYMLIFNEFTSLLEAAGFDVFLGFLHSTRYGRASLATDMMEEFRSPVVDRLVSYLINLEVVSLSGFSSEDKKGMRMSEATLKAYIQNYEKYMTTPFYDYLTKEQKTYRQIIQKNILQLEKLLLQNKRYIPHIFSY
jgi:CRISPR-associated protein Cas1